MSNRIQPDKRARGKMTIKNIKTFDSVTDMITHTIKIYLYKFFDASIIATLLYCPKTLL